MARRRKTTGPGFDLFPFLSILACILGCLLLIVMAMVALSVGPLATEKWGFEGTSQKTPVVVEWDGAAVTIHPGKVRVPAGSALANKGRNDSAFGRLLEEVALDKERRYIYVAVRPSGFGNFKQLAKLIRDRGLDIGYEPLDQRRPIEVLAGEEGG